MVERTEVIACALLIGGFLGHKQQKKKLGCVKFVGSVRVVIKNRLKVWHRPVGT